MDASTIGLEIFVKNAVNISMEENATSHVDIVEVMLLVTVLLVTAPVDVRTIGRVTSATNVQMDITTHYVLEHVVIVSMNKYVINMMVPVLVAANLILTLHYVKNVETAFTTVHAQKLAVIV